ncbi:MAG TPA: hypothetical protein GX747_04285 [Tenericutes bacterium]|nr:hypothetical protein [Mycoplasmatota bacterium]
MNNIYNEEICLNKISCYLSEGNDDLKNIIDTILSIRSKTAIYELMFLYINNIKGERLLDLWNSCDENINIFFRTIRVLRYGIYSSDEIERNFSLGCKVPFIDSKYDPEGTPKYDEIFKYNDPLWEEYCIIQKKSHDIKIKKLIESDFSTLKNKRY